jgi:hypothetical protein
MTKDKLEEKHYCDNVNCNHNNTKGLCCMFNPDNCKYRQLQKENAELDCQKNRNKYCYSCANATEKCFKNEIGCPCDKYKSYKDENAELEKSCDETQELLDKQIEATLKLDKENAELQAQIEEMKCCGNCAKNGHICVAEEMQGKLCGKNKDKWELRR